MSNESSAGRSISLDYDTPSPPHRPPPAVRAARIIVITLIGLGFLIMLLLPSLCRSSETANRVKCAANLKSLGQALVLYANDHGGALPESFEQLIQEVDATPEVLICPSSDDEKAPGTNASQWLAAMASEPGHVSYTYAGSQPLASVSPDTVLIYEALSNHNMDGINVLYGDGHVDFLIRKDAEKMIRAIGH